MKEMTMPAPTVAAHEHSSGTGRFSGWAAKAAVAAPVVALFSTIVGVPLYADDLSEVAESGRFALASGGTLLVMLLLGFALVGLWLRQAHALTGFGHAAFVAALGGTMLAAGGAWDSAFTVPYLGGEAPAVLDDGAQGSLLAGMLISYLALALGWLAFALATRRAGVLPRREATVLAAGAALAILPAPSALRVLVLAVGVALLARTTSPEGLSASPTAGSTAR